MKIAHLSDLHVCIKNKAENLEHTERLINFALEKGADHLVITGDLTNMAETKDFLAIRDLFARYDLLDSNKLSLVIGNHDIFGGVYLAEDILTFPQNCQMLDFGKKVIEFKNYFFEVFENIYTPVKDMIYPYAKKIGNIVLVGLNSCTHYSWWKNPFASRGDVEKQQIEGVRNIFKNNMFKHSPKIVMLHHYFGGGTAEYSMKNKSFIHKVESFCGRMKNKNRLLRLFKKINVDLVLHGHLHESFEYWRKGLHFLNAGGSVDKNKPGELKINFVTINQDSIRTEIRTITRKVKPQYHRVFPRKLALVN